MASFFAFLRLIYGLARIAKLNYNLKLKEGNHSRREIEMSVEVAIWRIDAKVEPISFSGIDYEARLQQIIADDISIVDPDLMVIGREVTTSYGGRIDILAMDASGNLVVIELKRNKTPREVVSQALDYGYWVRRVTTDAIADTFIDYQRRFLRVDNPRGIDAALNERFNIIPDELNADHRLVVVASELDPATERIVTYLQEEYGVDINVVFFQAFQDGERQYLTRAWLKEPAAMPSEVSTRAISKGEWNGEFYVCFGEGPHRRWNDAKRYGFVGAGGGTRFVSPLKMLQPGARVWVKVPGRGYVGVGEVTSEAVRFDQFRVYADGNLVPLRQVELEAPEAFDEAHGEHFVGINWLKAVEAHEAVKERGLFGNQNTVARPLVPKWNFTIERLKSLWGIS